MEDERNGGFFANHPLNQRKFLKLVDLLKNQGVKLSVRDIDCY
jgi:hypothetical protein